MRKNDSKKSAVNASLQYIIGIGASSGGLEAIYKVFSTPVPDHASFIIIQHLPADYQSSTVDLLASHTKKQVVPIKNAMELVGGMIYVLDERSSVRIKDGRLYLNPLSSSEPNKPINDFLISLAGEQKDKSVAVILSGSNDDGTEGTDAIRRAGGLVIAQDPSTTNFDIMPASVIKSGAADMIMAPELIMDEIAIHIKQKSISAEFTSNNNSGLNQVLDLVRNHTPLDFTDYKKPTLTRRIIKRMVSHDFGSLAEYTAYLKENPPEVEMLSREFLISVTSFFRDEEAFEELKESVIPKIADNPSEDPVKIWVVGCATGEEAYSIAMLIDEHFTVTGNRRNVKIFATDIDHKALAKASKGLYPESIRNNLSGERLNNYFTPQENGYKVKDYLRQMIVFAQHDVTKHPPYNKLDLISCRNMLIYMTRDLQRKIFSIFHFSLKKDGFLFLGPSENMGDLIDVFPEVHKRWKIYRNTNPSGRIFNERFIIPETIRPPAFTLPLKNPQSPKKKNDLFEPICLDLLDRFGFAGVCVDEYFNIIKTFGDYKKYLLPEMFTFHLPDLLPDQLSLATVTSMRKVITEEQEVVVNDIPYTLGEEVRNIDLVVRGVSGVGKGKLLVLFNDQGLHKRDNSKGEIYDEPETRSTYIRDLEEELNATKLKLRESEEALMLSIDNAQAYNEELMTNNEELQSVNEEVQSINEELQTVNQDYQETIKKLTQTNDDLNNYFSSTTNSQLFVDNDLIIRKFSPKSFKQINLKLSDIGRPLGDISTNIKFSRLLDDVRGTIETMETKEREIQTFDGKWYYMIVTPYLSETSEKANGAVITLNDITELKKTQAKLKKIIADHDTFIYSVSHDLKNELGNILVTSQYLNEGVQSEEMDRKEISQFSGYMVDSVKNLTNIVTDLSDIARIENEIMTGVHEEVDVSELLTGIRQSLKSLITQSNAKIKTRLTVKKIPFLKKNLRSIIQNLLTNAIKYKSPERAPEITITTEDANRFIILSIADNGMGIGKDKKDGIFSKYKRIQGKSTQGIEGSGIGLYLLDTMVQNAGGRIEVESEEGKGSTFKVWFPKERSEHAGELLGKN